MAKYLACGNSLYDSTSTINGEEFGEHIGGQAVYGTAGIRTWTKSVKMVSCVGLDFKVGYVPWLEANGLDDRGIYYELDYCSHVRMQHTVTGAYNTTSHKSGLGYKEYYQGFLEIHPEHIEKALDPDTVAFYHHMHQPDSVLFSKIEKIREKYGVRFMWELMYMPGSFNTPYFNMDRLRNAAKIAGMWSMNRNEASDIFGIPSENDEDIINELMKFEGVELCYYRVGSKGAYAVTPTNAYFCPSIDITESVDAMGCGNNSTAAAMYAWCETGNPLMTAVMASISAGFNCAQAGPWPVFTEADTALANRLAKEWYDKLRVNYNDLR